MAALEASVAEAAALLALSPTEFDAMLCVIQIRWDRICGGLRLVGVVQDESSGSRRITDSNDSNGHAFSPETFFSLNEFDLVRSDRGTYR
jgi:hypothetical protein